MFLGNIHNIPDRRHKLIDSVFKQCLLARIAIEPDSHELISKINTIQENLGSGILSKINSAPVYIDAFGNKNHWCNFHKTHGCEGVLSKISSIEHLSISDLKTFDQIIYTSTVPLSAYTRLKFKNWVITCTEGIKWDVPWLMEKVEEGYSSPLRKKPANLWNEQSWQRWDEDESRGKGQIPDYTAAKRFIQSGDDVLDLGCGLGRSGQYAYSEDVRSFTSTDANSEVLKYVPKYGDKHQVVTELDESKKYDVVLCMDVLEHVEHDVSFLKKIDSLSKNTIVITTPNFNHSKCRNRYHCREYRPDFFEKLIRETIPAEEYIFDTYGAKMTVTIFKKEAPSTIAHVPKKAFFYWGNDTMSWLRYMTLYSFRKLNPDWEMELHVSHIDIKDKYWVDPNQQDFHTYKGKNYLSEVDKLGITIKECPVFVKGAGPSHNSNFFKWNELATNGGIYSDMDILFVAPIAEYYDKIKNLQTGLSYSSEPWVVPDHGGYYSIGFMFSAGNNRFFKDLFDWSTKHCNLNSYQGAGVIPLYAMLAANRGMRPYRNGLSYIPMDLVYPWRDHQQKDFFNCCHTTLPKETIGIHWYAGHPMAQKFNNNIGPDTLSDYNNTMSHWLKKSGVYFLDD
jgi:2-polyprenyl-3-methyl-5-hydroxy-6-metoxy-1,4-benzoquinol methylase